MYTLIAHSWHSSRPSSLRRFLIHNFPSLKRPPFSLSLFLYVFVVPFLLFSLRAARRHPFARARHTTTTHPASSSTTTQSPCTHARALAHRRRRRKTSAPPPSPLLSILTRIRKPFHTARDDDDPYYNIRSSFARTNRRTHRALNGGWVGRFARLARTRRKTGFRPYPESLFAEENLRRRHIYHKIKFIATCLLHTKPSSVSSVEGERKEFFPALSNRCSCQKCAFLYYTTSRDRFTFCSSPPPVLPVP